VVGHWVGCDLDRAFAFSLDLDVGLDGCADDRRVVQSQLFSPRHGLSQRQVSAALKSAERGLFLPTDENELFSSPEPMISWRIWVRSLSSSVDLRRSIIGDRRYSGRTNVTN
jgi:hypothetical protein